MIIEEMSEKKILPQTDEIVVATVKRIVPYGAYVTLDEYNDAEGLIHISEISSRWVRDIRKHLREGQKTVLMILSVDPEKRHINLSLRRVTERKKRERLLQWKRDKRSERLLEMAAKRLEGDPSVVVEKVRDLLENHFGSLYAGFENVAIGGRKVLTKANLPSDWAEVLSEIAKERIQIPLKEVKGVLELTCNRPNGVEVLKNAFKKGKSIRSGKNGDVDIRVIGAPKYLIEVSADSYKKAEELLKKAVEAVLGVVKAQGGEGEFTRR